MTTVAIGMTTAMRTQQTTLEASTSHTSPFNTSDKQSHDHTSANPNHYLARKQHTQHHGTTTARAFNNCSKKTPRSYTSTWQQQHNSKGTRRLRTLAHTTHVLQVQVIPPPPAHLLIDSGASTHVCPKDYVPDLPLQPCGESVPQLYTVTNKKIPVYGIKCVPHKQDNFRIMIPYCVWDVKYPILSASRLLDRGYGLDFNPRRCTLDNNKRTS